MQRDAKVLLTGAVAAVVLAAGTTVALAATTGGRAVGPVDGPGASCRSAALPGTVVEVTLADAGPMTGGGPMMGGGWSGGRPVGADGAVSEDGALGEASATCADGEGDGIRALTHGWTTVDLRPGRYELVCNLPGHYAAGMYTELDVEP